MRRYDLTAEMYERRYGEEQAAKYKAALEHLNVAHKSRVLDVGCGTGLLFSHVAAEAQTVVGVDISRVLLQQAKEHAQDFRNVHLVQADADHLPFRDALFSTIFAFTVLQNMPKPLKTLSEIKRNAEQSGSVVVTEHAIGNDGRTALGTHASCGIATVFEERICSITSNLCSNIPSAATVNICKVKVD